MVQKKNFKNRIRFYGQKERKIRLENGSDKCKLTSKKVWFLEFNLKDDYYELMRFDDFISLMRFCNNISDVYGSDVTYFRVWEFDDNECKISRYLRQKFFDKKKLIEQDFCEYCGADLPPTKRSK